VRILFRLTVITVLLGATLLSSRPTAIADPSFGVDPGGPSALPPGAVLNPAPGSPAAGPLPVPVVIFDFCAGGPAGCEIDDISYGDEVFPPPAPWHAAFSVAPMSTGHPASLPGPSGPYGNLTFEGPATPPGDQHVEGDIYNSFVTAGPGGPLGAFAFAGPPPAPCGPIQNNNQLADGNGVGPPLVGALPNVALGLIEPPGFPPPFGDNLEALDLADPVAAAPAGPPPVVPVFFTVDPATAAAIGPLPPGFGPTSAADVLAWDPGTATIYNWAPAANLGLAAGNDIDALAVSWSGGPIPPGRGPADEVLFSFAPASPANPGLGSFCFGAGSGTPGDVYVDFAPFGPPPVPAIDAEMLGLAAGARSGAAVTDNLDALDLCVGSFMDLPDADMIDNACDFDDDNDLIGDLSDNCPTVANPGQANNDVAGGSFGGTVPPAPPWILDGVGPEGATTGGDACDTNDDNNTCTDALEPGEAPPRDPLNPWDIASMWIPSLPGEFPPAPPLPAVIPGGRDSAVALGDVSATLLWVGAMNGGGPNISGRDYDSDVNTNGVEDGAEYDRTPLGGITMATAFSGPPSGAVTLGDVSVVLIQVGDAC